MVPQILSPLILPRHHIKFGSASSSAWVLRYGVMRVAYNHPSLIVPGSSSGFGVLLITKGLENGDTALATPRKLPALEGHRYQYPEGRLRLVKVNVTKKEEVVAAFKYAAGKVDRIDIVLNDAGYAL